MYITDCDRKFLLKAVDKMIDSAKDRVRKLDDARMAIDYEQETDKDIAYVLGITVEQVREMIKKQEDLLVGMRMPECTYCGTYHDTGNCAFSKSEIDDYNR